MNHGIPKEDRYGRLHFYIRDMLEKFCRRIAGGSKLRFHLYCVNAADLSFYLNNKLENLRFDRVEVANIVDRPYLGLAQTLRTCGPLLKPSAENPHATLIALFMNAIHLAEENLGDDYLAASFKSAIAQIAKFAPAQLSRSNATGAASAFRIQARDVFRDFDRLFAHYMGMEGFDRAGREAGMRMKAANTVIDAWPLRLGKEYGEPGAQEAFDRLVASGSSGSERYVEWVRGG